MRRDNYDDFLERLLEQGQYSDVTFLVHGEVFRVHRCVLCARCPYFSEMFQCKWKEKPIVSLKHPLINPAAFKAVLQYLYTGRMDIDVESIADCRRVARQCHLLELIEELEAKWKQACEFVSNKPGTCVKVISVEASNGVQLQDNLAVLADCAYPSQLRVGFGELPFDYADSFPSFPDCCFEVENYRFLCHKAFFCSRSEYFRALLEDHFCEAGELTWPVSISVIPLRNITLDVFRSLLYYIYSNSAKLTSEQAYSLLPFADMYLLPGLKRLCGKALGQVLREHSVLSVWQTARLYSLNRLEDQCSEYMAHILDRLVELEEFAEAVQEDAKAVEARQETDSIPLVDDIRYHVTSNVQTFSALEEAHLKLVALDALLARLGIEC
uniref:Ankyrin repeat and BTB (POZ) domain containing 1 n=1 Tax=Eptatretus burgeri TaxID=7764 RepID=A0A8C4Q9P6_EPTBU